MESPAKGHSCSRSWSTFIPKLQLHFLRPTKALFYTYLQPFLIAKYIVLFCNPKGFGNCKIVSLGSTKKDSTLTAKAGCNCIRNYLDRNQTEIEWVLQEIFSGVSLNRPSKNSLNFLNKAHCIAATPLKISIRAHSIPGWTETFYLERPENHFM